MSLGDTTELAVLIALDRLSSERYSAIRSGDHVRSDFGSEPEAGTMGCLSRLRQAAAARAGTDRRVYRQRALFQPAPGGLAFVAFDMAGREGGDSLAHPRPSSRGSAKGPDRGLRRLSSPGR